VRIRPLDCDRQGVVGHPLYLRFFEAALIELWREAIGPYGETVGRGIDLAVGEVNVRYIAPARFDDVLDIDVSVLNIGTSSLNVRFDARVGGKPAAVGQTRYVCVAALTNAKAEIPDSIRRALAAYVDRPETAHVS